MELTAVAQLRRMVLDVPKYGAGAFIPLHLE